MPRYDFRCRSCGLTFEVSRPMARADEPADCSCGQRDTVRLLPTIAVTGAARASSGAAPAAGPAQGGGCCGGGCCG